MAKNYQRHSKGGRFRRSDIGDAGLRSYQEQQKNIIDAIRLTQQQDKDISRDQIVGLEGVAAKQAENQRIINNLESNVYKTKEQAIRRTAKSDVEALEGQAREYEKNSEFWKDFSTTYSRHWAKLAQETGEFKDRLWTDKWQDNLIAQYPDLINFEADQLREGIEKTLKKDLIDVQKEIRDNKNTSDDAREEAKTILRLMRRTNTGLDKIKVKQFTDNINDIEENLKRTIIQDEQLKWSSDTILQHYKQAAKNLVIRSGIRSNSKEAKELYALFVRKGTAAAAKARDRNDIIKTTEDINYEIEAVLAADDSTRSEKLSDLYTAITVGTFDGKQGKAIRGISNPIDAYFSTAQYLSDRYDDVDTFVEHMQSMAVDDQKGGRILWSERFKKQLPQHEYRLREIWFEANKDDITRKEREKQLQDEATLKEAKAMIETVDFTNKEARAEFEAWGKGKGEKTQKLVSTALAFDFENKNEFYLDTDIVNAWKKGQSTEFQQVFQLSSPAFQRRYQSLKEDMDALQEAAGYEEGGISKYAERKVNQIVKVETWQSTKSGMYKDVVDAYENAFYRRFNELKNVEDPTDRWSQARDYVDKLLEDGQGVFRRTGTGGDIVFTAFEPEADTSWDTASLDEKLSGAGTVKNKANEIIASHKAGTKTIISQDEKDLMMRKIDKGEMFGIPEHVNTLWKHVEDSGEYEDIQEFLEDLTGIKIPKGGLNRHKVWLDKTPAKVDLALYSKSEQQGIRLAWQSKDHSSYLGFPLSNTLTDIQTAANLEGREVTEYDAIANAYPTNIFGYGKYYS